jgi:hypothetical protein
MSRFRSALLLIVIGALVAGFFYVTEPRFGVAPYLMPQDINRIEAMNQTWLGTWLGLVGSGLAVIVGLWNIWRRPA